MKSNHKFILEKCLSIPTADAKILDFGCGKGLIVEEGIKKGIDIYGVEAFSFGGGIKIKDYLRERGLLGDKVREIVDGSIPFPDNSFDFIISNQVFEHVKDLDTCLFEIDRVLKKDGQLMCLFSSKEVVREGHCGIIFAHRFPRSTFRFYWLYFFRLLGFGRVNNRRNARQWAAFFNDWLVDSVSYRGIKEINNTFKQYFRPLSHIEDEYMAFRLKEKNRHKLAYFSTTVPMKSIARLFCRKWGGIVFIAQKD